MPRVAPRASGPANLRSTNFNDLIDFIERKEAGKCLIIYISYVANPGFVPSGPVGTDRLE